jgi:prepilin-type N-terminal cleavage/methylation domain-containing protein
VVKKSAFTLVELIFAIVIIAITVVSLPMMNQAVSKGIDGNIVQEAIFAAATELNSAVTASWDENSSESNISTYARVIETSDGYCDAITRLMSGHIKQKLHRRCLESNTTRAANSNTNDDVDALEDMVHTDSEIFVDTTTEAAGYKDTYTSALTVTSNASFGALNNDPNIKSLEITVKNSSGKVIVKLKTYSCNIGEVDYYSRSY